MSEPWKPTFGPGKPGPPIDPEAQRVFDTVTGPNIRMKDNALQALCVLGGLLGGAVVGVVVAFTRGNRGEDLFGGVLLGGFGGVVLSLLLSGTIIGIVRGRQAVKRG